MTPDAADGPRYTLDIGGHMKRWVWLFVLFSTACGTAKPVATPTPSFQNWHESRTVDMLTGKEIVAVWTDSEMPYIYNGMDTTEVGQTFTPQLWIRCRDHQIDVYISMGAFIDLGREQPINVRLDHESTPWDQSSPDFYRDVSLPLSQDGTTMFLTDSSMWTKAMSVGRQLTVEIRGSELTFNLTGYNEVVKPVLEACGIVAPTAMPQTARAPSPPFSYRYGNWSVVGNPSNPPVVATTQSLIRYPASTGDKGLEFVLGVICFDNKIYVYLRPSEPISPFSEARITYRFDQQPAQTKQFPIVRDDPLLLGTISLTDISERMLKTMSTSERLSVTLTPYSVYSKPYPKTPVEVIFSLRGYNDAVKPVLDACK
jgi:hypothetical protein